MENQYCGNCGTAFDPQTGICPNCGAKRIVRDENDAPTLNAQNFRYNDFRNQFEASASSDFGGAVGSCDGNAVAAPAANQAAAKKSGIPAWMIITVTVMVAAVVFVVLMLTGVIRFGNKSDDTTSAAAGEDTGVPMILEGVLTAETYNGNEIYVLNLSEPREFHPKGEDAEVFGSTLTKDKVQVVSDLAAGYVNHSVRVDGTQRYRSESAHRYEVIMVDVQIEDQGAAAVSDAAGTNADAARSQSTAAPVTTPAYTEATPTTFNGDGLPLPVDEDGYHFLGATMTASTYHPPNDDRHYEPGQAADGDTETCWMAYNPKSYGADTWIKLDFGEKKNVAGLLLLNGNCWNDVDDVYHLNGRVCEFIVYDDNNRPIRSGVAKDVRGEYQSITFPEVAYTSSVRFYVNTVYKGSKNSTVVCISELRAVTPD